ncbi:hypothetical protein DAERI_020202 [Deinococcus aerius]|uniref:Uncharacterized protein n=2 Tax=Deinococcus TaxID=1298 RepID=A0A2I9DVS9_9DEIO|nr:MULTISPECIES: hypothetical protein [Deinococcus]MBB5293937.1 hypothetical protein [Deinococcus metallilatus]QBY07488.1 hypothetical protein E5F05_05860 [Deinococcus metallilatus]RXJ14601.1 hypothetical protein ERJ73_02595 [Deinococcus metallilatus]TLK30721.1 hypothetical protein FCS05_02910 [Deinococcus metallilatus]GBF04605.1 hypothetical protein DAERI_020202 [Deinococcus aerius]
MNDQQKDQHEAPARAGGHAPQPERRDLQPPEDAAAPEVPPPPALKHRVLQRARRLPQRSSEP